jgi:hypothetical protein
MRDSLSPEDAVLFDVFAVGLTGDGKLAMGTASGSCRAESDPPSSLAPYHVRADAERERSRLLEKFHQGCRPSFWSPSVRLEIWTLGRWAEAVDSGQYAHFPVPSYDK